MDEPARDVPVPPGGREPYTKSAMATLRIATLNIWNRSGPWAERRRLIRRELDRLRPAVVGLQEVVRSAPEAAVSGIGPEDCQAVELAEGSGFHVLFATACEYRDGSKFGNALLTQYPVRAVFRFALPDLVSGEARSLLGAFLDAPDGVLPVFVTHLNWKLHHGAVRLAQVRHIVDRIAELVPENAGMLPAVLMGDFNADPDSDEIRFLRGLKVDEGRSVFFADAWVYGGDGTSGATFCRTNDYARVAREPSRRIDYIFVRGSEERLRGEPLHTELAFATPEIVDGVAVWPSDHFGVVTDVAFER